MRKIALLGSALLSLHNLQRPRIYGPRVYATKDEGKSYGLHKCSNRYHAITAEEAPTKRECIRRRRQLAAAAA